MPRVRKRISQKQPEDLLDIPAFLDRRDWTEEDWERNRQAWDNIQRDEREKQQERNRQIFARAKRYRQRKVLRSFFREQRKDRKLERKGRRLRRDRMHEEHDGKVIGALRRGAETVGQISKSTELTTKEARRSLKRLLKRNRVVKLSGRRYNLIVRKRKRLSDEALQRLNDVLTTKPKRRRRQ